MISIESLSAMYSVGLTDMEDIPEIEAIPVNQDIPKEARILQYIETVKNPYYFRVGGHLVKTQFAASGPTLQNALLGLPDFIAPGNR